MGWCCLQYLLALSPATPETPGRAKRLEIKVYLRLNQQNSDKTKLLRPIRLTVHLHLTTLLLMSSQ